MQDGTCEKWNPQNQIKYLSSKILWSEWMSRQGHVCNTCIWIFLDFFLYIDIEAYDIYISSYQTEYI